MKSLFAKAGVKPALLDEFMDQFEAPCIDSSTSSSLDLVHSVLMKNVNAITIAQREKEQRDRSKMEHEQKKQKDKEEREKQKQKAVDRKEAEKKRTQKGERRR